MWMMLMHLYVNQKSDYDDGDQVHAHLLSLHYKRCIYELPVYNGKFHAHISINREY